jgi:hypothetical protein
MKLIINYILRIPIAFIGVTIILLVSEQKGERIRIKLNEWVEKYLPL